MPEAIQEDISLTTVMTGALQLTNVSDMQVMEVNGVKTWAVIAKHHPFPSLKGKKWRSAVNGLHASLWRAE